MLLIFASMSTSRISGRSIFACCLSARTVSGFGVAPCGGKSGARSNGGVVGSQGVSPQYLAAWDPPSAECYANCDGSSATPALNVLDFNCFLNQFNSGGTYANCDGSTTEPVLTVLDFNCFLNRFNTGCP